MKGALGFFMSLMYRTYVVNFQEIADHCVVSVPRHPKDDVFLVGGKTNEDNKTATADNWFWHREDNIWVRKPALNIPR